MTQNPIQCRAYNARHRQSIHQRRHRQNLEFQPVLEVCSVDLYLDQQSIDTITPAGGSCFRSRALFAERLGRLVRKLVRRVVNASRQMGV
jgi:hypothetical protein